MSQRSRTEGNGVHRPVSDFALRAEAAGRIVRRARLADPPRNAYPGHMRQINLLVVLDAFRSVGEMSRATVARATGISASTASKTVQELIDAGILMDEARESGRIARPSTHVRLNASCCAVVGIDLGGTHLHLALSDFAGQIHAQVSEPIDPESGPEAILGRIVSLCRELHSGKQAVPMAVGMATPGTVDTDAGVVRRARNLRGWENEPLRQMLEDAFGVPAVIENDVNAAAMGERWHGAAQGHESFIFVAVGTGIGAGLVIDGRPYRGAHFAAGEINLVPMRIDGEDTFIEDRGSGPAIVRRALALGYEPPAGENPTALTVFEAAATGDRAAVQAVEEGIKAIAFGAGILVAAVDPSIVVLGGGVSTQGDALLLPMREAIARVTRVHCDVVLSELGADAQLHGALYLGLKRADLALVDRVNARRPGQA